MTPSERRLWTRLRANRFHGLKFQRQEPVGPYIVDFYCPVARIVIELDGQAHGFTIKADQARDSYLADLGLTILRIPNSEVIFNLDSVLERIYTLCSGHIT